MAGNGEILRLAVLGAGSRGWNFARLVRDLGLPAEITAVAEPREKSRSAFAKEFQIPSAQVFSSWQEFIKAPGCCDAVILSTMDRDHTEPAIACMEKGLHLLLEKPMAPSLEECRAIETAQRRSGVMAGVCHSLRYHPGFHKVKELLDQGRIGRLITMDQIEQVGFRHFSHSFVRGNWGNSARSTFMLMAKSCHDVDYISYLVGRPCLKVSSFGSLDYFRKENAPKGAPLRCTDGCPAEASCAFSAPRLYSSGRMGGWLPKAAEGKELSRSEMMEALKTGPFGRCVFQADNDVVDHQVLLLEYAGSVTATFTMTAFTERTARKLRLHGTHGELEFEEGGFEPDDKIIIRQFLDGSSETIRVPQQSGSHGGGDGEVLRHWLEAILKNEPGLILTNLQESLRTHTIVFAAESSRLNGRSEDLNHWYEAAPSFSQPAKGSLSHA